MAENKEKTMEEKMLEALEQVKNELAGVKEENAAMKEKLVAEVLKNSEEQREAAYELMEKMEDKNE